jgi:lipopolysaccharide transport system permease protein
MATGYMGRVWAARHFWIHLSLADLRSRWRRSFFGILWTIMQPLGMTLLLAFVFGKIFSTPITEYAPYVLSGMVIWEFAMACVIGGALAFVQADAYIKQYNHPLAIYSLRTVLTNLAVLMLASLGLVVWVLVAIPDRFGWPWLAALTVFPILALALWPLSTLLAYVAARFRDLPHALGLVMQAMWFVSPIYFEAKVFRGGGLDMLVDLNPIYHLLQIVRAPLLQGLWPTLENYAFCIGTILVLSALAWMVGRRAEGKVIFYL